MGSTNYTRGQRTMGDDDRSARVISHEYQEPVASIDVGL
jgi:hypothetical protein